MGTLRPKRPPRSAFTLMEMLVVMSIVSVLLALLLPTLSMARGKSRSAACMSNLRQVGIAMEQYKDIYDNYVPKELFKGDVVLARSADGWSFLPMACASVAPPSGSGPGATLDRFIGDPRVLLCPSRRNDATVSYGINGRVVDYVFRFSDVRNPSDTPLVVDSQLKNAYNYSDLAIRHEGCANILYLDGHVAARHYDPLYGFGSAVPLPGATAGIFDLWAGVVRNRRARRCKIQVLGAAAGLNGPRPPVSIYYSLNSGQKVRVCANAAQTVEVSLTDLAPGDTFTIIAQPTNAAPSGGTNGRRWSLLDKTMLPDQSSGDPGVIQDFLANYIDPDRRTDTGEDSVLFLFNLSDAADNPGSSAADYQDAVVLVTFYEE